MMEPDLEALAEATGTCLQRAGRTVAVAESCTGGWVAKLITDIPGSSAWFDRGFVTYSNAAKQDLLDVEQATLEAHGAVSEPTARAMVAGTLAHSRADLAVAITGIAGPGGGSAEKPVGTVWIAWGARDAEPEARCHHFAGDRDAVRAQAAAEALRGLISRARGD